MKTLFCFGVNSSTGWGHLLEDAARIENGGLSSYALTKNKKSNGGL